MKEAATQLVRMENDNFVTLVLKVDFYYGGKSSKYFRNDKKKREE